MEMDRVCPEMMVGNKKSLVVALLAAYTFSGVWAAGLIRRIGGNR